MSGGCVGDVLGDRAVDDEIPVVFTINVRVPDRTDEYAHELHLDAEDATNLGISSPVSGSYGAILLRTPFARQKDVGFEYCLQGRASIRDLVLNEEVATIPEGTCLQDSAGLEVDPGG